MKHLLNLIGLVALLVLTACGGATSINPEKSAVDFTIEGGEETVNISADGSWDVAECPEWIKTDVQDSVLVIKIERNQTGAMRSGDIVLKGKNEVNATIKVTQVSKCTHITPASDKVEFEKEGGTQTVNIDTDGAIKVEVPDGFTASFANGVLTITATANEEGAKRGEIKLTADNQSATIYASQKGNICPTCGGSGKVKCSKCGGSGYLNDEFYESIFGCSKCGGRGKSDRWADYDYRKGSGKMDCPTCGGTGH